MFSIFQVDLPIGRTVWLVALALISTRLALHVPLNAPSDPSAAAISLFTYTGYSIVAGFLFSFAPKLIVIIIDFRRLLHRCASRNRSALLFENSRFRYLRDILTNVGVVCAAVLAAPRFGDASLNTMGCLGMAFLLIIAVINPERWFSKIGRPLLELRPVDAGTTARLFLAGMPFAEIELDEDFGHALAHLLDASWEIASDVGNRSDGSAWLRKNVPQSRIRFIAHIVDHYTPGDFSTEIKASSGVLAFWFWIIGGCATFVGGIYLLYWTDRLEKYGFSKAINGPGRYIIVAALLVGVGLLVSLTSTVTLRWLSGESLLTGRPKKSKKTSRTAKA